MRTALVLGGAGFLGRWLVDALLAAGVDITSLDRQDGAAQHPGLRAIRADAGVENLRDLLGDGRFDAVFHLAGPALVPASLDDPQNDLINAVLPTLDLLEAARKSPIPPRIVYVSSAAVYGEPESLPVNEEHQVAPKSPYGISKLACEHYVRFYTAQYGVPSVIVRPFSLYGPGQRKLVVYDLAQRFLAGEDPLLIAGRPGVTRDFVFAGDAARALAALGDRAPGRGECYNIASGRGTSLEELTILLAAATGRHPQVDFTGILRAGDPQHWVGDPALAMSMGVACDTPMAEGLRLTVEWCVTAVLPGRTA